MAKFYIIFLIHCILVFFLLQLVCYNFLFFATRVVEGIAVAVTCFAVTLITFRFTRKSFLQNEIEIKKKAVLITGCARGIGNALAKHLDSKGFYVFASCRDPDSPGANDLRRNCSSRLQVFQLDVRNDDSVQRAFQFVEDNLGPNDLWAIINNAGIMKGAMLELTSIQDFKDTLEVNAIGPVRVTKVFLPLLRHSRGRVINIASVAGRLAFPMLVPYSMSKFACVGFSESLRYELDLWGVQVISIEPEIFETDMTVNAGERFNTVFADVAEDVEKAYVKILPALKSTFNSIFPPCPNMRKLIEVVECAVCLKHPDAVYKVCRNVFVRTIWIFWDVVPTEFKVFLVRIVLYLFGLPKLVREKKNT